MSATAWLVLIVVAGALALSLGHSLGHRRRHRTTRPTFAVDPARCKGCLACLPACRHHALTAAAGRAAIDMSRCTGCGHCAERCRVGAVTASAPRVPAVARRGRPRSLHGAGVTP